MNNHALCRMRSLLKRPSRKNRLFVGLFLIVTSVVILNYFKLFSTKHNLRRNEIDNFRTGFVLSLTFYEQMGNAASNLMNLQCWASSLKMKMFVVEPFIREDEDAGDKVFFLPETTWSHERFGYLFDRDHWDRYSASRGYAPLTSIETFIKEAPRNIIYVHVLYGSSEQCPTSIFSKQTEPLQSPLLTSNGFKMVKKVCVTLLQDGRLRTQDEFYRLILGDLSGVELPGNFTIVFDEWRAIRNESEREGKLSNVEYGKNHYRILIKDSLCTYNSLNLQPYYVMWEKVPPQFSSKSTATKLHNLTVLKESEIGLIPTSRVIENAATYRANYLGSEPYLSVMIRTEKMSSEISRAEIYTHCINKLKHLAKYAIDKYKLKRTFLSSDLGKHGTKSLNTQSNRPLLERFQRDIVKAMNLTSTYQETIDAQFEKDTHSKGRVEIAWTQSVVLAQARCAIFMGGGAFQGHVLNMNSFLNKGNECFMYLDSYCNEYVTLGFH